VSYIQFSLSEMETQESEDVRMRGMSHIDDGLGDVSTSCRSFLSSLDQVSDKLLSENLRRLQVECLPKFSSGAEHRAQDSFGFSTAIAFIEDLDMAQHSLSLRTNLAYWLIGNAYETYRINCVAGAPFDSMKPERFILRKLFSEPWMPSLTSNSLCQNTFKKRLVRGRKFYLLTKLFPISILLVVPAVCITQLDFISLQNLKLLCGNREPVLMVMEKFVKVLEPYAEAVCKGLHEMVEASTFGNVGSN